MWTGRRPALLPALPKAASFRPTDTRACSQSSPQTSTIRNGEPMKTKHINITNRTATQLPYILACAIAAFLGFSGVAEGQEFTSFEEFGRTFCHNPNGAAVGAAIDSAADDPRMAAVHDSKGRPVIDLLILKSMNQKDELCDLLDDRIPAEELAAVFNIGVSLANIQTDNLERRMEDIRAGAAASARRVFRSTPAPDFSMGLAGPTGPEGKSGPSVMQPTPENRWGVFVTGIGEFTNVDDTSVAHGYYLSTGGVTFGADYRVSPNFAIGLTGGLCAYECRFS